MRRLLLVLCLAAANILLPAAARAQEVPNAWLPWIGCWQSAAERVAGDTAVLCIVPNGAGLEAVSVVDDVVTGIDVLAGDGTSRAPQNENCSGTRHATGSSRGNLLFVSGEYRCAGLPPQSVAGVHAFIAGPRWVDIQAVAMPKAPDAVRIRYYARMGIPAPLASRLPADLIARADQASQLATESLISVDDIVEASHRVRVSALETLLIETRAVAPMTRREILAMNKAAVADSVIDLAVALSYPDHFHIRAGGSGLSAPMSPGRQQPEGDELRAYLDPFAPAQAVLFGAVNTGYYTVGRPANSIMFDRFIDFGFFDYEPRIIFYEPETISADAGGGRGPDHGSVQNGKGYEKGGSQPSSDSGGAGMGAGSPPRTESSDSKASSGDGYSSGSSSSSAGRTAVER